MRLEVVSTVDVEVLYAVRPSRRTILCAMKLLAMVGRNMARTKCRLALVQDSSIKFCPCRSDGSEALFCSLSAATLHQVARRSLLTGICAANFADTLDEDGGSSTCCAFDVFSPYLLGCANLSPEDTMNKFLLVNVRGMLGARHRSSTYMLRL